MSKKLAILGHSTRGKEVIELLKMMGGDNIYSHWNGDQENMRYFISEQGNIDNGYLTSNSNNYEVFTLEEFWEKYPFKVGDIVDRTVDYVSCVIDKIRWNSEKCCVEYHLNYLNGSEYGWHVSECLIKPENLTGFMQMEKTVSVIFNSANYEDEVELQLGDYEIEVRDGKTYAVKKKPKYPKTYDECSIVMDVEIENTLWGEDATEYEKQTEDLIKAFIKLRVCRDAYWKTAGEEMGLGKPWAPDWNHINRRFYCIYNSKNNIVKNVIFSENKILTFPTEEMRDAFCENFKELIEKCKELL